MLSNQDAANPRPAAGARASRRAVLSAVLAAMAVHANAAPTTPSPRSAQTATTRADEALPQPRYTLQQLLELARANHPVLAASQAQVQAAQAGIATARAWPNPEVEAMAGRQRARMPGVGEVFPDERVVGLELHRSDTHAAISGASLRNLATAAR